MRYFSIAAEFYTTERRRETIRALGRVLESSKEAFLLGYLFTATNIQAGMLPPSPAVQTLFRPGKGKPMGVIGFALEESDNQCSHDL